MGRTLGKERTTVGLRTFPNPSASGARLPTERGESVSHFLEGERRDKTGCSGCSCAHLHLKATDISDRGA